MLSKNEIKYIQSLKAKKERHEAGVFVVEGPKIISELIGYYQHEIVKIFSLPDFLSSIPDDTLAHIPHSIVTPNELERISFLQTPQQCLALVRIKHHPFVPFVSGRWSLMLDGIQDPGNVGTIIRIADWFGIELIYASHDTAELYNPKVVQATMGSLLRVKMMYGDCASWLQTHKPECYTTAMKGKSIWEPNELPPGVVVIGNEGKGVSTAIENLATTTISIPKIGGAESLNAGVATGIILSHLLQPK